MLDISNVDFNDPKKVKGAFQDLIKAAARLIDNAHASAFSAGRTAHANAAAIEELKKAFEKLEKKCDAPNEEVGDE